MVGIKKNTIKFPEGEKNSISSMYNIQCDLDLGADKADVRKIP